MKLAVLVALLFAICVMGDPKPKEPSKPNMASTDQKLLPGLTSRRRRNAMSEEQPNSNAYHPHYPHMFLKVGPSHESEDFIGDYETKPEPPQQKKCVKHFMDLETLLDAVEFYLGDFREFLRSPPGHRYLMEASKRYFDVYLGEYRNRLHGEDHALEFPSFRR